MQRVRSQIDPLQTRVPFVENLLSLLELSRSQRRVASAVHEFRHETQRYVDGLRLDHLGAG
jgi:hypothetical protein